MWAPKSRWQAILLSSTAMGTLLYSVPGVMPVPARTAQESVRRTADAIFALRDAVSRELRGAPA